SGDIAYQGAPAEYERAGQFFNRLREATGVPPDHLLLVPGNHDVDRKRIKPIAKQAAATLTTRDAVNEQLADADSRRLFLDRFSGYAHFVTTCLPGHPPFDGDRYFYVQPLALPGCRVA